MTSKELVQKIIADIKKGLYATNEKLPSENQFVIKYGVSRTLVSKTFETLKQVGAIYSVPKKGYFVAEFFSGLVQSVPFFVRATKWKDQSLETKVPPFFQAKTMFLKTQKIGSVKRTYFKQKSKVAISYNWYNMQLFSISKSQPIIDTLVQEGLLKSSVSNYFFEHDNDFANGLNLVNYQINYSENGIAHIAKIIIDPKHFKLVKQEFVL